MAVTVRQCVADGSADPHSYVSYEDCLEAEHKSTIKRPKI